MSLRRRQIREMGFARAYRKKGHWIYRCNICNREYESKKTAPYEQEGILLHFRYRHPSAWEEVNQAVRGIDEK